MPELMERLGVKIPGKVAHQWQQLERRSMHELQYGSPFLAAEDRCPSGARSGSVLVAALALRAVVRRELSSEPDR